MEPASNAIFGLIHVLYESLELQQGHENEDCIHEPGVMMLRVLMQVCERACEGMKVETTPPLAKRCPLASWR